MKNPYLRTLGAAALEDRSGDDQVRTVLESSKLLALLTYLNAAPARSATRDHLVHLLWADLEADAGRHALRHHLWLLKQKCGDAVRVDRTGETLVLATPIRSDIEEMRHASDRGDLAEVVALYQGEFFPDFAGSGSQEFEHWVDRERAGVRSLFIHSAQLVVRQWLDQGRARDAGALARRVRDADMLNQSGWRLVLEALVAGREWVTASVEADALTRFLAAEDVVPEPSTLSSILAARSPAGLPVAEDTGSGTLVARELVGREAEFAALIRRWDEASRGKAQVVRLCGPAGIGKTRLLQEFAARLVAARREVVQVRASRAGQAIEGSLLSDLVTRLAECRGAMGIAGRTAGVLIGLAPGLSSIFRQATPTPTIDSVAAKRAAVRELLTSVAEESPIAVLVDDVHWGDAVSRQVLLSAIDSLERARVLVVLVERDELSGRGLPTIPLGPLSSQAIETLLASIAELPEEPWARDLVASLTARVGGSPLHLLHTLQHATQRGALRIDGQRWVMVDSAILAAVMASRTVLQERLAALTLSQGRIVGALAHAVGGLPADVLASVCEMDQGAARSDLQQLEAAGLVVSDGPLFALMHDEIADTARRAMSEADRRDGMRRIGATLGARATTPAETAYAAVLLRECGATAELSALFDQFVRQSRRVGDHRTLRDLAAQYLGHVGPGEDLRWLVRQLPFWRRWRLDTSVGRGVSVGLAALAVVGGSVVWSMGQPTSFHVLTTARMDASGRAVVDRYRIVQDWDQGSGVLTPQRMGPSMSIDVPRVERIVLPPNDTLPILLVRQMGDTSLTDLFEYSPSRGLRRLTSTAGDDTGAAWAPDGSAIAFTTSRWSPLGHRDVAILDRQSGTVRQLTSGARSDGVSWSPDGTRIAYLSTPSTAQATQLCSQGLGESAGQCVPVWRPALALLGWIDESSVLLQATGEDGTWRVDVATGDTTRVATGHGAYAPLGGGEAWVCHCMRPDLSTYEWTIARFGATPRPLLLTADSIAGSTAGVIHLASAPRWIDRYFGPDSIDVVDGVPSVVTTRWRRADGSVVERDAAMIRTTATNQLLSRASGEVLVRGASQRIPASIDLDGWRSGSVMIRVQPRVESVVLSEAWRDTSASAWRWFGEPSPTLTRSSDGASAWSNNGDGRFNSGAYSRAQFARGRGLALRTRLSGQVTATQWQVSHIELRTGLPDSVLRGWDHRTGYLWGEGRMDHERTAACEVKYPGAPEGAGNARWILLGDQLVPVDERMLASGRWFDVDIQWLPDGRCAYLINQSLIWVSTTRRRADSARVVLYGNSVGTRMLVGPLRVYEGVLGDVLQAMDAAAGGGPERKRADAR